MIRRSAVDKYGQGNLIKFPAYFEQELRSKETVVYYGCMECSLNKKRQTLITYHLNADCCSLMQSIDLLKLPFVVASDRGYSLCILCSYNRQGVPTKNFCGVPVHRNFY